MRWRPLVVVLCHNASVPWLSPPAVHVLGLFVSRSKCFHIERLFTFPLVIVCGFTEGIGPTLIYYLLCILQTTFIQSGHTIITPYYSVLFESLRSWYGLGGHIAQGCLLVDCGHWNRAHNNLLAASQTLLPPVMMQHGERPDVMVYIRIVNITCVFSTGRSPLTTRCHVLYT